jgi:hypothetical protein
MTSTALDNLVNIGKLKQEPADQSEFDGLLRSGRIRLADARNPTLALESRFDLAYNAAHALALAALRWRGYRPDARYLVFQVLPHTLGLGPEIWRVLAKCHEKRNLAEYEGFIEIDERLTLDLIQAAELLLSSIENLAALPKPGDSRI